MSWRCFRMTFLSAVVLTSLGWPTLSIAQENHQPHWAYSGPEDPRHWGMLDPAYAECSQGHLQSPIDIRQAKTAELPALKIDYQPGSLNIIDNGHTVQVNVAPGSTLTVGGKSYALKQFHFHHPSEEHINGRHYDLVAHLVHADADGHLAVVAVLFEKGDANPLVATLWKNIPTEKGTARDFPSVSIQAQDLLPSERGYFTFTGSLTTPPCSEGVTWYVLKSHPTISPDQVAAFSKLYPKDARPIQPTNGREILQTK
jgi:carbonic anhydrase